MCNQLVEEHEKKLREHYERVLIRKLAGLLFSVTSIVCSMSLFLETFHQIKSLQ